MPVRHVGWPASFTKVEVGAAQVAQRIASTNAVANLAINEQCLPMNLDGTVSLAQDGAQIAQRIAFVSGRQSHDNEQGLFIELAENPTLSRCGTDPNPGA